MSRQGKTGSAVVLTDKELQRVLKTILGSGNSHTSRNYLIINLSHLVGLRAKGWNYQEIADWFNENDYTTPRGHRFLNAHAISFVDRTLINSQFDD